MASQSKLESIYIDTESLSTLWIRRTWDSIWMGKFRFTSVKFNSPEAFPFDKMFLQRRWKRSLLLSSQVRFNAYLGGKDTQDY